MRNPRVKILIGLLILSVVGLTTLLTLWMFSLDRTIAERLAGKRFLPPVEFYSRPMRVVTGQKLSRSALRDSLRRLRYKEKKSEAQMQPGEYAFLNSEACQSNLGEDLPSDTELCALILKRSSAVEAPENSDLPRQFALVAFGAEDTVFSVFEGEPLASRTFIELEPMMFAQFFGTDPIMRDLISLEDAPAECLNAVVAIEDSDFLRHSGVSVTGIARAVLKNLTSGRVAQGGSTITQQLVKNYFLNPERTFKRKVTEMAMAILLETRATKDEILETYINEIYMGQNGSFQIRGYGSAAYYYFGKELPELNLAECATLAALVNSPGLYNPFTKSENAIKRRSLVLSRMEELGLIAAQDRITAEKATLPKAPQKALSEPAPYYVEAAKRELESMSLDSSDGLRIYTALDLQAQEAAQSVIRAGLDRLEKENKAIRKIKDEQKKSLEGSLVSADPLTGEIVALVGGRNFRHSQFNRAIQSKRQVGSIFKPIVYLTALQRGIEGETFTPLTLLPDEKFKVKYEGQEWSPTNYDKKTYGMIPAFFALKNSLNIATSGLALKVGLDSVIEVAHDLGIDSELKPVPSLALGAFEMAPVEVLQVYTTVARFGERLNLTLIRKIEDLDGREIFKSENEAVRVANEHDTAVLVGMLKQTVQNGTAWFVPQLGYKHPAAGKTGTTSDTKDAWFAGFTPFHVAVVWVGYDDNTQNGLTGASGAVPIWAEYMRKAAYHYPPQDFAWPEDTQRRELSIDDQIDLNIPEDKKIPLTPIELIL